MKTALLIIVCLVFVVRAQTQWEMQNPLPAVVLDIEFTSPTNGWLVGTSGAILKTTTGGNSWFRKNSGTSDVLNAIFFINAMNGTAVGIHGTILQTTDGGETWLSRNSGTTTNLFDVFFINQDTGFTAGDGGLVLKTTNGGMTWEQKESGVTGTLFSLWFIDQLNGMAGLQGAIIRTSDGGESWTSISTGSTTRGFAFSDGFTGIAVGLKILKTTDSGNSWFQTGSFSGSFRDVFCIDENNFIAVGTAGIYGTTDGGNNWYSEYGSYYPPLITVAFTDYFKGIALGYDGIVVKTTNSGSDWTPGVGTYVDKTLNSVIDVGYIKFLAVGDGGTIAISTNSGSEWNIQNSGTTKDLFGISMIDESSAAAVGDSGMILLTTDMGTNWQIQTSGISSRLRCVSFPPGSSFGTGFAVGDDGIILKTTSGGVSWFQQNSGVTEDLYSVYYVDELNGYVCGGQGKILNTTDGGTIWNVTQTATTNTLRSISFFQQSASYGNAVGENGTLLRTTDGGDTWNQMNSGQWYNFYNLALGNTSIGFLCADQGFIMKTINKGGYWHTEGDSVPYNLYSIAVSRGSTNAGVAVGESGVIIRKLHVDIPVELTSFTAESEGNEVILNWVTATETNNHGFEIQRNINDNWSTIGFVNGHGTSSEINSYSYRDNLLYQSGTILIYRLKQVDYDGSYKYSDEIKISFATNYNLFQNYPNPFNPTTAIIYQIPVKNFVTLIIYNSLGEQIAVLVNEEREAGKYTVAFNGSNLSSGIYFYQLKAGKFTDTRKFILLR